MMFMSIFDPTRGSYSLGRVLLGRNTLYRSGLVKLFGLITCGVRRIGQVARLLGARAEVRLDPRFRGRAQFDEDGADGNSKDDG